MPSETKPPSAAGNDIVERGHVPLSMPVFVALLCWMSFQFVLPAAVIARLLPNNWLTLILGILGGCALLFEIAYTTFVRVRTIYDPGRPFEPTIRAKRTIEQWRAKGKRIVAAALFVEYAKIGYLFALAYAALSRLDRHAFNVPLSIGTAFYYSITTLATVGYGDIVPRSPFARTIAVIEIFAGLLYAALVLSVIATHLQKRSSG
jgi:hypothetical protein